MFTAKSCARNVWRKSGALTICLVLSLAIHIAAQQQGGAPKIDGVVTAGEYGAALIEGRNVQTSGGAQWYMTWDDDNLYVAIVGANPAHGAVMYLGVDAAKSVAGSRRNARRHGSGRGYAYDETNIARLPFAADFVAYFKNDYREYRRASSSATKSGDVWSAPKTSFGDYAAALGTTRELAIPWSLVAGGKRPAAFRFLGYIVMPDGFTYAQLPPANDGGRIGTNAAQTHFYVIRETLGGVNKAAPFATTEEAPATSNKP